MNVLYCKQRQNEKVKNQKFIVRKFTPGIGRLYLPGEEKNIKKTLVRIYFQLMTLGKARLFYVGGGKIMHSSYVVPHCFKFSFLKKSDFEIGPCYTAPEYRGRGIYPEVLRYIVNTEGSYETNFYMVVNSENKSSIRGIEKAGFKKCGKIVRKDKWKRYYVEDYTNE